ncbi:MAG: malonyl-CoA decarboxylase [Acidiferrobacterales bacterium]|nr:malonyl-CoA decarboxylase [Acidiferrobacterales bacterium]
MNTLCALMMASDGEYSSLLISERILTAYDKLDDEQRLGFFNLLDDEYGLNTDELQKAVESYSDNPEATTFRALTHAAEPKRQELFRRLNLAPGGTKQLVKMREHLLQLVRDHPKLGKIDVDFRHLFNSWFNRGFLIMQPIDWTTPAHILEKIIAYEAVHEIGRWAELRRRLEPEDRHCFAFFHPAMEDEPLVFVEVALTPSVPTNIDSLLDSEQQSIAANEASCAIFYSISNCHAGLAGVSFGNFLIKQVATSLKQRFPQLRTFATISPVPGFRRWFSEQEVSEETLAWVKQTTEEAKEGTVVEKTPKEIAQLAATYLVEQKNHRGEPLDPVARFHLKNGASLDRMNWHADRSPKAIKQSIGLMVNYIYDLTRVEENHENYMQHRKVVCSSNIRKLLVK